ncbi:type II secretion system protein, partial [Deinococcus sp.]|uniref:type IV pilin protein n=1 Tax=Deinococcus sp. TaxID=47478 RepID=UPI002869B3C4
RNSKKRRGLERVAGFTLIELLISIAIIGILASVMIPALLGAQRRSYDTGAQACAKSLQTVQGLQQIDTRSYSVIGSTGINSTTDGINAACKQSQIYIADRSLAANLASDYIIDVWDRRGSKVFTVNPAYLAPNTTGATAFSPTGAGGSNLP